MVGYDWYQLHIIYKIIIVAAQRNISTYTIAHSSGLNTKSRKKKEKKREIHKIYRHTHTEAQSQPSGLVIDRWNWGQDILVLAWLWRHTSTRPLPESVLSYWFKQHGTPFLEELSIIICDVGWIQWASESALWMEVSWFISPWHQQPQHRWSQHMSSRLPVLKLNLKHVHIWIMKFPSNCYVN